MKCTSWGGNKTVFGVFFGSIWMFVNIMITGKDIIGNLKTTAASHGFGRNYTSVSKQSGYHHLQLRTIFHKHFKTFASLPRKHTVLPAHPH